MIFSFKGANFSPLKAELYKSKKKKVKSVNTVKKSKVLISFFFLLKKVKFHVGLFKKKLKVKSVFFFKKIFFGKFMMESILSLVESKLIFFLIFSV